MTPAGVLEHVSFAFDEQVVLRDIVTSVLVTHQIRDAHHIATRQAVRTDGRLEIAGTAEARGPQAVFMVLNDGEVQSKGSMAEQSGR